MFSVPKDRFQGVQDLKVGMRFEVQTPEGAAVHGRGPDRAGCRDPRRQPSTCRQHAPLEWR